MSAERVYEAGKRVRFPFSGNAYRIVAVDNEAQTVTLLEPFGDPADPEDWTTHSFDDLASADVAVLP